VQRRNLRYDEGDFKGQANGGKVQELLKAVLDDTAKEEADAHKAEQDSREVPKELVCIRQELKNTQRQVRRKSDESQTKVSQVRSTTVP
jgi:hypothetical protein